MSIVYFYIMGDFAPQRIVGTMSEAVEDFVTVDDSWIMLYLSCF